MKQHFLIKNGHKQLLLFFAGWGMDEHPFLHVHPTHCDWMICYDYRSLEFDEAPLNEYTHVTLIAWSMGVWAASQVMKKHPQLLHSVRIAINGTPHPIDETKGISPTIFEGTLEGLNEQTLRKFQRRMCSSAAAYKSFQALFPQRPLEELKTELEAIGKQASILSPVLYPWHTVYIGNNDRIFLPQNQREAWDKTARSTINVEAAHYQSELFNDIFLHTQSL